MYNPIAQEKSYQRLWMSLATAYRKAQNVKQVEVAGIDWDAFNAAKVLAFPSNMPKKVVVAQIIDAWITKTLETHQVGRESDSIAS